MRTNPVGPTPRGRAPPPEPCQSPSSHVHLGSYGSKRMTSPDYPFVTLLVVKLQRRTDQNDLEINLPVPTLEVVSPYPDPAEESFYLFLPLPQASPQNGKFHETRRIFPDYANKNTYTESQERTWGIYTADKASSRSKGTMKLLWLLAGPTRQVSLGKSRRPPKNSLSTQRTGRNNACPRGRFATQQYLNPSIDHSCINLT